MDTSVHTKQHYESNPFTTVVSGIKKLWELNANALVGLVFFSLAAGLLLMASLVAIVIALIAFMQQHGLANWLTQLPTQYSPITDAFGQMNSVGIYVTWAIGLVLIIILVSLMQLVAMKLALASSVSQSVGFGWVLKQSFMRIFPAIGLALLLFAGVMLPLVALFVLGEFIGPIIIALVILGFITLIYVSIRFSYAWLSLVDGRGPIAALAESWAVSGGHFFETLGIVAASVTVVMLPIVILTGFSSLFSGIFGGILGLIILLAQILSITFVAVGIAERFRQLRLVKAGKLAATKTDPLNYLALIAMILLLFLSASFKQHSQDITPLPTQLYGQQYQ